MTLLVLDFDFSGFFVGYAILFAIVVLYYLLLSAYIRAWIIRLLTWFLNRFLHFYSPADTEISVGSIAFAFLSGKVYANHIRYRTANMSVLVLQVTVRWNWWYIDVREGDKRSEERLPCRLSIECVGVEVVLHHNSATYDHLAALILKHPAVRDKAEAAGVWFHAKSDNNTKKTKQPRRTTNKPTDDSDTTKRELAERAVNELKKAEQSIPAFYSWFPVTKVSVKTGAVMVGNLKLPQFLVVQFTTAKVIHALTPPSTLEPKSSPHCYFQSNTQVSLHTTAVYLSPNPAYIHSDDIINIKRSLDAEDYFAVAIGAFGRFLSELDSELASMQREGGGGVNESRFIRSYRKGTERSTVGPMSQWSYLLQSRDKRKKQDEEHKERERAAAAARGELPNATEQKEKGSIDEDDASSAVPPATGAGATGDRRETVREKEVVFECAEVSIDYTFDITTLLSPYDVAQLRLYPQKAVTEAPLTRMQVTFLSPVSLRYGPHIDNQRVLLMSYFKPFDYQNQQVYTPRVGQYREYATFDMHVIVGSAATPTAANSGESVLRVAYREASKLREAELARERSGTGWFDFYFNRDSSMHYRIDLLPKRDGTHSQLTATLNQLTITPSFTKQTFIDAEQFQLVLEQEWPVQWNDCSHWKYNISFHSPHIYYLSAHLDAFSDLMADWSSYTDYQQSHRKIGGAGLEYFQPSITAYTVSCSDYELLFNANEYNIIDRINSADSNTHVSLRGPDLQFVITMNNTDWKARANSLVYELSLRNVHAHLRLPLRHPLSLLCDTGLEAQMFYATNVSVRGNKMYHYKYNADYRDSHSMVFTLDGVEVELAGHYARYFLSLYNNYVGDTTHHLSSADFVLAGYRNIQSHVSALKRWESNVPLNAYESYITLQMENVTVNLPDHLFTNSPSHQPKLRWYDMQVELRSVQQYTDVFLSLSPVTLTVPLASGMGGVGGRQWEGGGDRERGWNEKETSVQLVGFVLSYHSSKGDPPRSIVYRSSMKVMLDELNAQLLPSQLACLLSSLSAVTQQYADAADYNQPPVSTSTLIPTIDSNNDTLELITAKKQLTSYLQDQMNTALADNTIELAVGCIKLNLLHPPPPRASGSASRLSLTRLLLSEGAQLSSSTLITPLAHSKRTVEIPTIELSHLIANDSEHSAMYSFPAGPENHSSASYSPTHSFTSSHWVSLAEFRCGALLTIADQRADCVSTMRKQQDFIYSQMHQEAAGDENEQYSWHEQNATKVPYMYNDELAAAGGLGAGAMPLFSVTQAVSEGYGLGVGGVGAVAAGGGVQRDMVSPLLGLRGLDQARHHAMVGLGELHTPQLHSPELQSPSHLFSPPMNSPLPRDSSQATIRSDISAAPILPPTSLADRLRSHAQKRSVQIARTGLVVPRPSHHSVVDRPPPMQSAAAESVRPNGVNFHRRPSLMASVAFQLDPKPPMLRRLSRRAAKNKPSSLSHSSERKDNGRDKDEDEEKQFEPPVTVDDEGDEEEDGETEDVSRSSFESCQSFSQRAEDEVRGMSRLASSSSSRDAGEDTWQDFREEGQPQHLQSLLVHDVREEGQRYLSLSPSPSPSPLDEQWRSPHEREPSPYSYHSTSHSESIAHIPPLPLPMSHTGCLPSFELQQYLEHYSMLGDSHSFMQRKHASSHAASLADPFNSSALASALSPSAAPHSVLSMDADLAGTTAGAYLILPSASFQPRDFTEADDGHWYSPSPPPMPNSLHARSAHFASTLSYDDLSHHHHRMRPTTLDQMHRDQAAAPHRSHLASPDAYYRDDLDEQENPTFTNTRHVMIDAIQDVALTITPEFVASLDHYVPLIQSSHASIEDTLDELHLQFSRVFSSDAGEELSMALAREKPFTARSNVAVSIPSVSMELLQSAPFADIAGVTAASSLVYSTILCVDALSFKQTVDYPLPEGFGSANSASSFPSLIDLATPLNVREPDLPPQLPSTERTLSFTRLHVFSSLLNPSVHLSSPSSPLLPFLQPPSPSPIAIPSSDLSKALPADLLSTCLVFVSWEIGTTSLHFTQIVDVVLHDEPASFTASGPITLFAPAALAAAPVPVRTTSGRASQLFTFEPTSVPGSSSPVAVAGGDATTGRSSYNPPTHDTVAHSSTAIEVLQPPAAAQLPDIRWKHAQPAYTDLSPVMSTAGANEGYPYAPMSPHSVAPAVEERKVASSGVSRGPEKRWLFTNLFTPSSVSSRPQYLEADGEAVEMVRLEAGQAGSNGGGGSRHKRRPSNMSGIEEESEDVVTDEKEDDSKESSHTSESRAYESEVRDKVWLGTERRVSSADVSIPPSFAPSTTPSASVSRPNTPLSVRRLAVAAAEDYRDPNSPSVSYHHHRRIAVTVKLNNVRVLMGRDAPQRLTTLLQTWYSASQQLELLRMMDDSSQLDKHDKDAAAPGVQQTQWPQCLTPLLPGGPSTTMRRYRWQSVLSFALQHLQHSRVLEGQRNANMAFTEQDQVHLLQWYHYQIMRSIKKLEEGRWSSLMHDVSEDKRDMLRRDRDELLALLAQYGCTEEVSLPPAFRPASLALANRTVMLPNLPPSALAPHLHAILHHNTLQSDDVNFIMSTALTLTLAMRKLLRLPVALQRRLNFKLQRLDANPQSAASTSPSTSFASELEPHLDYSKLFQPDKLRTSQLALCSLRTFASLAPQAAKVQAVYGYLGLPIGMWRLHLSPALWWVVGERISSAGQSGSRFDERHKVRLDQEDQHVEVDVNNVQVAVVEPNTSDSQGDEGAFGEVESTRKDHTITLSSWIMHAHSISTPRLRPDSSHTTTISPTPIQIAPTPQPHGTTLHSVHGTPYQTTPAATPIHAPSNPSTSTWNLSNSTILRPSMLSTTIRTLPVAQSLTPVKQWIDPLSPQRVAVVHEHELVRVKDVVLAMDCQQLSVEFSPSLHHFLSSITQQMERMQTVSTKSTPDVRMSAGHTSDVPPPLLSSLSMTNEPAALHMRPRSASDPPQSSVPVPAALSPVTQSNNIYLSSVFGPPPIFVTHFHLQLSLSSLGFRVRMPNTGSILLSTGSVAVAVSRFIPSLGWEKETSKRGKGKNRKDGKAKQQHGSAQKAATDYRTGSLRKDREEKKHEREAAGTAPEKESEVAPHPLDYPLTSCTLKLDALDMRLLDAESVDVPLTTLVASALEGNTEAGKRIRESVLTSLITQKLTISAMHASDTSPLITDSATQPSNTPALSQPLTSSRPSLQRAQLSSRNSTLRRSLFLPRPNTATAHIHPSASLAVVANCDQSVLTLPFYELESLYFADYLGPWRPTIDMLSASRASASTPSTPAAAATHLPTRVTAQLSSASLVMLPLPSVMITYHVDRLWSKVITPRQDELHLLLSVGEQNRATDAAEQPVKDADHARDSATRSPSGSSAEPAVSALPVNSHKITLHSANVRKRKDVAPAKSGHHTRRPTAFQQPASLASLSSLSSSYGGLGAVLYSRMQFVLDFSLPTLRTSLTIKRDAEQQTWRFDDPIADVGKDGKDAQLLDPAVAAALMRLSSEQTMQDDTDDDSSQDDSYDSDDSTHSRTRGTAHNRDKEYSLFTLQQAAEIRVVEGVIAVGGMSNQLNENVLNRLLHLQATLNTELNQLIDKVAHYTQTARNGAAVSPAGSGSKRGDRSDDVAEDSSLLERYCFHVSVVLDDVHVTAGLDASKKTHRNRRAATSYSANASAPSSLSSLPVSGSSANVYFDSSWDPMIVVRTGTVSFSVRYTPHAYRLYKQHKQLIHKRQHQRRVSRAFGGGSSMDINTQPVESHHLPVAHATSSAFDTVLSSDIVIELNCYGAGLELTTSGRERYDAYTLVIAQQPRRALTQLSSHIALTLGLDMEQSHVAVKLSLHQPLMKVTAVSPLVGSAHALADRYGSAYQHYQRESAKLKAEDEYSDPLQGLKQLQAAVGHSSKQSVDRKPATTLPSINDSISPFPYVDRSPFSPLPASEVSVAQTRPNLIPDVNTGNLAKVLSLLDTLRDTTRYHLLLAMEDSEIVILLEKPTGVEAEDAAGNESATDEGKKHNRAMWGDESGRGSSSSIPSIPPSPAMGAMYSTTTTPMYQPADGGSLLFSPMWSLDDNMATSPSRAPDTARMTAVVLSLEQFRLHTDYVPAAAASSSSSSASSNVSSTFPASAYSTSFSTYRPMYARQPTNVLYADISGEGLELGFLTNIPETNNLKQLAAILLQYREAVTPPPIESSSAGSNSRPPSVASTPTFRPVVHSATGFAVDDGDGEMQRRYLYNRLLVRSSSMSMQVSLPVVSAAAVLNRIAAANASAVGRDKAREKAAGQRSTAAHQRNFSIASSVASGTSYLSSSSSTAANNVVTRDITVQIHTESSGCEIDIDPSLVHHAYDASALVELLSSVSQEALDEHWTQQPGNSPPPSRPQSSTDNRRLSVSPPAGRSGLARGERNGGATRPHSASPVARRRRYKLRDGSERRRRRRGKREGRRPTSQQLDDDDDDLETLDQVEGVEGSRRRRFRLGTRRPPHSRQYSYSSSSLSSSSSSDDGDDVQFDTPPSTPGGSPSPFSPPLATSPVSSLDIITKTDVVVEIEVNISQGRLCLHPTPPPARKRAKRDTVIGSTSLHSVPKPSHQRHVSVDSGLNEWTTGGRLRSPRVSGSAEYPASFTNSAGFVETLSPLSPMSPSTSPALYGVFLLPSIVCTYLSQHNVRTEHVLMVDLTVPPLSFSPPMLQFFEQIDVERQKATALRRSQSAGVSAEPLSPVALPPKRPGHHRHVSIASNASRGSALSVTSLSATGASPASSLFTFLSDSSLAQRAFTITLRVRPASVSFRCNPSNEHVFLKVGTNRPFDVAVSSATFQLPTAVASTDVAPSLPAITVTAHLASMYAEMGSDEPNAASQFSYVRLHHARLHIAQAYNMSVLAPSLPTRTAVFSVDHLAPGKVNVSACSNLLIFLRSWSLDQYGGEAQATAAPSQPPVDESPAVSFQHPTVAPLPSGPQPMLYLLLSIGKVRAEANMLDIENVNNRAILSLTRFSLRCVDLGGLPAAPRPFLLSAEVKEIHLESQPDLDGLEGTLMCQKGVKVRLLRLPLSVAAEEDEEDLQEEQETWMMTRRRRRRTRSYAGDEESDYSDYAPSPSGYYDNDYFNGSSSFGANAPVPSRHKRMVNKLECVIQRVHLRFALAGGRVELLKGDTSQITISVQDQFYPTAPLELFDGRRASSSGRRGRSRWSGRWVTQSDIDVGERLVLGASSHAIPYFIDIITLLIKFLQHEISKYPVQPPPSLPATRPTTAEPSGRGRSGLLSPTDYSQLMRGRAAGGSGSGVGEMIDDGSGNLRLTGRMIRVELNTEDERDRAVASLVEYSLSLTKERETKPIDPASEAYHLLAPADILRGEKETLRVLLLDVGKHRLDEDNNNYEYLPIPSSRPYTQGVFLSRLTPPSDDREVVRVPGFVLEMETLEYQWSDVIRSRLLTFWDKAMTVSVDVRHYKFMQALVSEFVEQYNTAVTNVHQQAKDMRETAKRAVDQQHRDSIVSVRNSRHLQPPNVRSQSNSEALSPRSVKFSKARKGTDQLEVTGSNRGRAASANTLSGIVLSENGKVINSGSSASGSAASARSTMIKSLFQRRPDSPIRLYHKDEDEEKKEPTITTATHTTTISTANAPGTQAAGGSSSGVGGMEADGKDESKEGDKIKPTIATTLTIDPNAHTRTASASPINYDTDDSLSTVHSGSSGGGGKGSKGPKGDRTAAVLGGEKHIDVMGVVEFNPQIHVLDNTSSGISSRKVLELLGMKGDLSIIPQSTHQLTMLLDTLMEACHGLSRAIDRALE